MNNKSRDPLRKAREYAFLLLKFRLRSEKEIANRLKKKGFAEEAVKETVVFLKEKGFLNDELFAKTWVNLRIKKPLGLARVREELRLKGIEREIINRQIEKIKEGYCEEDIAAKIAREKLNRLKEIDPCKAKRRVFAYLLRRGFSPDIISDTLNQL